jgi:hypothetical protein
MKSEISKINTESPNQYRRYAIIANNPKNDNVSPSNYVVESLEDVHYFTLNYNDSKMESLIEYISSIEFIESTKLFKIIYEMNENTEEKIELRRKEQEVAMREREIYLKKQEEEAERKRQEEVVLQKKILEREIRRKNAELKRQEEIEEINRQEEIVLQTQILEREMKSYMDEIKKNKIYK